MKVEGRCQELKAGTSRERVETDGTSVSGIMETQRRSGRRGLQEEGRLQSGQGELQLRSSSNEGFEGKLRRSTSVRSVRGGTSKGSFGGRLRKEASKEGCEVEPSTGKASREASKGGISKGGFGREFQRCQRVDSKEGFQRSFTGGLRR